MRGESTALRSRVKKEKREGVSRKERIGGCNVSRGEGICGLSANVRVDGLVGVLGDPSTDNA